MRDANWMSIEKVAPTEVDWKAMDIDELVDRLTPGEIQKLLEEFDPDGNLLINFFSDFYKNVIKNFLQFFFQIPICRLQKDVPTDVTNCQRDLLIKNN